MELPHVFDVPSTELSKDLGCYRAGVVLRLAAFSAAASARHCSAHPLLDLAEIARFEVFEYFEQLISLPH
jgi:hypothetical protein